MTEDQTYMLKAIASLADARAYVEHVEQIRGVGTREINTPMRGELQILKSQIMCAYDRCTFLYEVLK